MKMLAELLTKGTSEVWVAVGIISPSHTFFLYSKMNIGLFYTLKRANLKTE